MRPCVWRKPSNACELPVAPAQDDKREAARESSCLNLHYFGFFAFEVFIDRLDETVG